MKEQDLMVGMSRIILNNLFFFRCVVAVFSAHSLVISGAVHAGVQISQSHYMVAATCQATWLLLRLSSFPR